MYTDEEAEDLVVPALSLIPVGKKRPKTEVFAAFHIDPKRLRDHRAGGFNLGQFEAWQLSESFDLIWWGDVGDDLRIFGVCIRRRNPGGQPLSGVGLLCTPPPSARRR